MPLFYREESYALSNEEEEVCENKLGHKGWRQEQTWKYNVVIFIMRI